MFFFFGCFFDIHCFCFFFMFSLHPLIFETVSVFFFFSFLFSLHGVRNLVFVMEVCNSNNKNISNYYHHPSIR